MTLDLYIDGQRAGSVRVMAAPGSVQLVDLDQLLPLLPPLRNDDTVAAILRRPLSSNSGSSCFPVPRKDCGRLQPDVAGVIVSRDAGRIDLFLARSVRAAPRLHLPDPPHGPATVAGALDLQYTLARTGVAYTLRQRSVTGLGRSYLAIDTVHTDRFSELDRAYLRRVGDRVSLTGGLFRSRPYSFVFFDRFLGLGLTTTNETRVDRATMNDTPLVIDGLLSGRVEIYRDDVLLDTQILAPGEVTLDTSRLPGGVYPVTLKLIDASGERTETRMFARAANLPAPGLTDFFVEAGANVPFRSVDSGFLPHVRSAAVRAGVDRRVAARLALSGRIEGSRERQLVEIAGTYLARDWRMSATGAITKSGERAGALTLSGSIARMSWSLDARAVNGDVDVTFDPERGLGRSYRQVTAFAGWNSRRLSLNLGTFWRREADGRSSWSVFTHLLWTFLQRPGKTLQMDASGNVGRSDWSVRIGIRASLSGGRSGKTLFGGVETRHRQGGNDIEPIARADWRDSLQLGMESLALRGVLLHESGRTQGQFGGDLTTARFQVTADAILEEKLQASAIYGRASAQFGFADGRLAFGSGSFTGAGIIAEAPRAPGDARFAVRNGRGSSRPFAGEGPIFVSAPPFSQASIGIDALGSGASLDTRSESAIFFPGTVKRLVRQSTPSTVIFGRLMNPEGQPMPGATVVSERNSTETDKGGFFQIEAVSAKLMVTIPLALQCVVDLPATDMTGTFKDVGAVVCQSSR